VIFDKGAVLAQPGSGRFLVPDRVGAREAVQS
jgi:hypothetical protein